MIEIGHIWLGLNLQRTREATEAIYLLMRHAFDDLGYRRFEWKCNAANAASRRAAERFGFTFEGIFRQHQIVKGRNRDTAWYAILDHEWPAIRAGFERWLDHANFDGAGRQRRRLGELAGEHLVTRIPHFRSWGVGCERCLLSQIAVGSRSTARRELAPAARSSRVSLAIDGAIIAVGVATLAGVLLFDLSFGQKQGLLTVSSLTLLLLVVLRMYGLVQGVRRGRERADSFAAVGAALATATNRREIYAAALGAATRLTRVGHEITLYELSDEALSPVAATGTRSREARYLAGIDEATLARLRAAEGVETDSALLLPLAARGVLLGLFEISGPALERHDRSLLVALAHQLSLALESAALTEDLHRSASEARLGSLVRHSSELVAGGLRRHHDQLREPRRRARARTLRRRRSRACRLSELMMPGERHAARARDGRGAAARRRPLPADLVAALPPGRERRPRRGADHRSDGRRERPRATSSTSAT